MGLFDKLFQKPEQNFPATTWSTLTAYSPVFHSWGGEIYEQELVRSAIDARARAIAKLKVEITGTAKNHMRTLMKHAPNEFMTWYQFLYRTSTILDVCNNCVLVPIIDINGETTGFFPVLPQPCKVVEHNREPWLQYKFHNGQTAYIEMSRCAILTKHQYKSDHFGDSNDALKPTMELIDIQNQGIKEGIKSSATYRFTANVTNFTKTEDLAKERLRFNKENFKGEGGGILLFPNTYANVKQIEPKPFVIDPEEMKQIKENVCDYFGVSDNIMQNKATADESDAFYEGAIEPFAIQLGETLTKASFTLQEQTTGNEFIVTSNRIRTMSASEKLNWAVSMLDRGIVSLNEVREVYSLGPIDGGDVRIIRGEYYNADEKTKGGNDDDGNSSV